MVAAIQLRQPRGMEAHPFTCGGTTASKRPVGDVRWHACALALVDKAAHGSTSAAGEFSQRRLLFFWLPTAFQDVPWAAGNPGGLVAFASLAILGLGVP